MITLSCPLAIHAAHFTSAYPQYCHFEYSNDTKFLRHGKYPTFSIEKGSGFVHRRLHTDHMESQIFDAVILPSHDKQNNRNPHAFGHRLNPGRTRRRTLQ